MLLQDTKEFSRKTGSYTIKCKTSKVHRRFLKHYSCAVRILNSNYATFSAFGPKRAFKAAWKRGINVQSFEVWFSKLAFIKSNFSTNTHASIRVGSIRVYCRVRPFLPGQPNSVSTVDRLDEGSITINTPAKYGKDGRKSFTFNKVFDPSATQGH